MPLKQAEKRNEQVIEQWIKEYGPIIAKELARPDTVVLLADEAIFTSEARMQKTWLRRHRPSIVLNAAKREMVHFYGFLEILTGLACAFKTNSQTGEITVSVLRKLAEKYAGKRIVIIWDNASWHKSQTVRDFLKTTDQFQLYNFPPYAPELNPQEHIWKEVRHNIFNNRLIKDIHAVADEAIAFIQSTIFNYKFLGLQLNL